MSLPSGDCWTLRHTTISGLRLLDPQRPRAFSKHRSLPKARQHQSERPGLAAVPQQQPVKTVERQEHQEPRLARAEQ
jgi:hypothetical protein